MDIFPIGTISANSDSGTIDGISFDMFEPNNGCRSQTIHDILVEKWNNMSITTRKRSLPMIIITYKYYNIYTKEFRQIERFVYDKDDALTSFYVIDFSKGQSPSSITNSGGDWVVAIDNTKPYSTNANMKSHHVFIWDGRSWKEGPVNSIVANTSITVDVDTSNYGNLSLSDAQAGAFIYPMYTCYFGQSALVDFEQTIFIDGKINTSDIGGYMYSGTLNFSGKYKV